MTEHVWPERLTLRDTKIHADEGQRIYTTATGYGYEKREYVRADAYAEIAKLRAALEQMVRAVCGETGFAQAVRHNSGFAYPWPALDIAEETAMAALNPPPKVEATAPLHERLADLAASLDGEYPPHVIADLNEASRLARSKDK